MANDERLISGNGRDPRATEVWVRQFAAWAHEGQEYRPGLSYMAHIDDVVRRLDGLPVGCDERIIAFLHDTLEDTVTDYNQLVKAFTWRVALVVQTLTRFPDETYAEYIEGIRRFGAEAVVVKLADLQSNLAALDHPDCPPDKKGLRSRYEKAIATLSGQ